MPELDDYVDIRELNPACVKLPCRTDGCENERWVCGSGSTRDFTVCEECSPYDDLRFLDPEVTVRV
jgi:hypothetical protein